MLGWLQVNSNQTWQVVDVINSSSSWIYRQWLLCKMISQAVIQTSVGCSLHTGTMHLSQTFQILVVVSVWFCFLYEDIYFFLHNQFSNVFLRCSTPVVAVRFLIKLEMFVHNVILRAAVTNYTSCGRTNVSVTEQKEQSETQRHSLFFLTRCASVCAHKSAAAQQWLWWQLARQELPLFISHSPEGRWKSHISNMEMCPILSSFIVK